jgi:hypothetical protein
MVIRPQGLEQAKASALLNTPAILLYEVSLANFAQAGLSRSFCLSSSWDHKRAPHSWLVHGPFLRYLHTRKRIVQAPFFSPLDLGVGAYGSQVINGVLAQVFGSLGCLGPLCGHFPVSMVCDWDDHGRMNLHFGSLTCRLRAIVVEKWCFCHHLHASKLHKRL